MRVIFSVICHTNRVKITRMIRRYASPEGVVIFRRITATAGWLSCSSGSPAGPSMSIGIKADVRACRLKLATASAILAGKIRSGSESLNRAVVVVAKYLVLFSLTGETIKRFVAQPSDRAAVVRELAESVGGSLESYYWMFGQYDGAGVFVLPDSPTMAALSLAATSSGAFTRFETHELIEASDLIAIADRAKRIAYHPPGA
jgi:uncharacterized protein with GYD domain